MRNESITKETEEEEEGEKEKRKERERKGESSSRSLKPINHPSVKQSTARHDSLSGADY